MDTKTIITIQTTVNAPMDQVWHCWTEPAHITQWNNASPDWHTPRAKNDLKAGGRFLYRMEAKDGSMGFDFSGTYSTVIRQELIEYTIDDGRKVKIEFRKEPGGVTVVESFEAETVHPAEMQRTGWQAILDNFKNYTEEEA